MAPTTLPKSFKVILKTPQTLVISHPNTESIKFNVWIPLSCSHNFLYFSQIVYEWPSQYFLRLLKRFWRPSKILKLVISAKNGLGINSQGFWSILDDSRRNWNDVTNINILGTLKLAQNLIRFSQMCIVFKGFQSDLQKSSKNWDLCAQCQVYKYQHLGNLEDSLKCSYFPQMLCKWCYQNFSMGSYGKELCFTK